jgi:zinc transporter ZupT
MKTLLLFLVPLALLGAVVAVFVATDGAGLDAKPAVPVEAIDFERTTLHPGTIELRVRNTGQESVTLAQAVVRDMVVQFKAAPSQTIGRMETTAITIPYPWVDGEMYEISFFSSNSIPFTTTIAAAAETKISGPATFLGFSLIGLYVGIIPVFLGIFWLPALRRLGKTAFTWLMALTVGLLVFLAIDTVAEALEGSAALGGPFQGPGLIGIGAVGAFLLLDAVSRRQAKVGSDEAGRQRRVAFLISLGIGLHNLGEGLAIGSAFSLGEANLGKFFVIGFILQNITEGLGIIAPIVKQKPSLRYLAGLGLLGGAPAMLGAWIGGIGFSPAFSVFFLALGTGAVLEVAYEIGKLIAKQTDAKPFVVSSGVLAGMALLYATGLLIK